MNLFLFLSVYSNYIVDKTKKATIPQNDTVAL